LSALGGSEGFDIHDEDGKFLFFVQYFGHRLAFIAVGAGCPVGDDALSGRVGGLPPA
jgi:hypothetical protein